MAQVDDAWINEVTDDTAISTVDDEIRETRQAVHERLAKEHVTYADTSSTGLASIDGYHLAGSAKAWAQAAAPTARPDGVSFTLADKGRIWIDETADTGADDDLFASLKYYDVNGNFKPINYFPDKCFFPDGVSIGGVEVTGTGFDGFLGVNESNQLLGVSGDLKLASGNGIVPVTTGTSHLGTEDKSFGSIYGDAVYGAVGNDVADIIDGLSDSVVPGACYVAGKDGIKRSCKRAQRGTIGVCTDSASLVAGNKTVSGKKIAIAVAGFPMGFVDKVYRPGTALVSGAGGTLTRAPWWVRVFFPERIVGVYFRAPRLFWGEIPMKGRAVIKVV